MDTCVFCEKQAKRFPSEHWAPRWLAEELAKHSSGVVHNIHGVPRFKSRRVQITLEHVCGECNGTWMSDIETRARRHVFPMIIGDYTEALKVEGLQHIVRWCYLKAICLEVKRPPDHVPTHASDVYAQFRETKQPPYPNCSLALGARDIDDPDPEFFVWATQALKMQPEGWTVPIDWYHTTFLIGHLVVDMIGTPEPHHLDVERLPGLQVLWPGRPGARFTWPPKQRLRWRNGLELN